MNRYPLSCRLQPLFAAALLLVCFGGAAGILAMFVIWDEPGNWIRPRYLEALFIMFSMLPTVVGAIFFGWVVRSTWFYLGTFSLHGHVLEIVGPFRRRLREIDLSGVREVRLFRVPGTGSRVRRSSTFVLDDGEAIQMSDDLAIYDEVVTQCAMRRQGRQVCRSRSLGGTEGAALGCYPPHTVEVCLYFLLSILLLCFFLGGVASGRVPAAVGIPVSILCFWFPQWGGRIRADSVRVYRDRVHVRSYAGPWRVLERTDPINIDRRMALPGFGLPGITVNIPRPDVVRLVIGNHSVYLNVDTPDGINEDPVAVADYLEAEIDPRLRHPGSRTLNLKPQRSDGEPPPG